MSSRISSLYISVLFSASKVVCLLWDYVKEKGNFFQKQGIGDNFFLKEKKIKEKGALTVLSNIGKIFTGHKIISNRKKTYRFVSLLEYPLVSSGCF